MWFFVSEDGQGLVAYALILILVAIVVVAGLSLVGADVLNLYTNATDVAAKTFTR
jgi:pilus assembly protein Flp/PilA